MKRGFSTLEIVIAMAVLVSSFTAVVLLTSAESLSGDTQLVSEALTSARKALEEEQALARKDFKLVVATSSPSGIAGIQSSTAIAVSQIDSFTKKVVATVSWQGTYGRTQNVSLSALVTNFGNAVGGDTCSSVLTGNWKTPAVTNAPLATTVGDSNVNASYPVTAMDAYQKYLYVAVSTSTSPTVPEDPSSGADNNAVGTLTWSNPSRVTVKDGSVATLSTSGTNVSHYLKATNFGFSIPPGVTIVGIRVDVLRSASNNSSSNAVLDSQVKLVKGSGVIGIKNNADTSTRWPSGSLVSASYGYGATNGSSDPLWSEKDWTSANINNPLFGVVLAVTGNTSSANRTANVDSIKVTVYYTKQFYILNLTNPASPAFVGGLSTSTVSAGISGVAVATSTSGSYAYVSTGATGGTNQFQVINVSDPTKPFVVSTYPSVSGTGMGSGVGNTVFYKDGYAYVGLNSTGGGPEFNILDVSVPSVPVWKGGYTVGAPVNAIVAKDGYAYVTTNDPARELVVLNVTNPASPTLSGTYNATPDQTNFGYGRGLYTVGDMVYLGRSWTNSSSIPQFLSLNASSASPTSVNSKSLGTYFTLHDIIVRDYLAFLLVGSGTNGGQLQIINATTTAQWATPVSFTGGSTGVGGVAMDCEGNYIYSASLDSANKAYITTVTAN